MQYMIEQINPSNRTTNVFIAIVTICLLSRYIAADPFTASSFSSICSSGYCMLALPCLWQTQLCWIVCLPQALLKKHEALMSDLNAYSSSIQALKEQAQSCRVNTILLSHLNFAHVLSSLGGVFTASECWIFLIIKYSSVSRQHK